MQAESRPLIDPEHAAFVQGCVSISLGSRSGDNIPNVTRGLGCRVSGDRRRVTIFLSAEQSRGLLSDIRENGAVAAVFSLPSTHRTVQFKGTDATVGALSEGDLELVASYRDAFVSHLVSLRYNEATMRTLVTCPDEELVSLTFSPCSAFSQTPGPAAGAPLGTGS
jgi:hypothetical protein